MSNITYVTGDVLLDSPENVCIAHACNAQGVWGSGVAKQAKEVFPEFYTYYNLYCRHGNVIRGEVLFLRSFRHNKSMLCMFTSNGYGQYVDSPEMILWSTKKCLLRLENEYPFIKKLHIPKINSGAFNVPWEETEKILKEFDNINFIVYTK